MQMCVVARPHLAYAAPHENTQNVAPVKLSFFVKYNLPGEGTGNFDNFTA
jgi:hypothetical protein